MLLPSLMLNGRLAIRVVDGLPTVTLLVALKIERRDRELLYLLPARLFGHIRRSLRAAELLPPWRTRFRPIRRSGPKAATNLC